MLLTDGNKFIILIWPIIVFFKRKLFAQRIFIYIELFTRII